MVNISKPFLDYKFKVLKENLEQPHKHQQDILKEIVKMFSRTQYASDIDLKADISPDEYLSTVPLCRYDDLSPYISSMKYGQRNLLIKDKIKYYAESSGTTGRHKHIPLSKKYVKECLIKGSLYSAAIVNHHIREATEGKMVVLPGSLREEGENQIGDVSAIMAEHIPFLLKHKSAFSAEAVYNDLWESKLDVIIEAAETNHITGLSGLPTWNLKLLEHYAHTHSPQKTSAFIDNIRFFVHGGVSIDPYRERFNKIFGDRSILFLNVYNSTEGFFAFQDDPTDDAMSLFIDGHVYYEFVTLDQINLQSPDITSLKDVEIDKPYVMIISTTSGLYRYILEDVIAFTNVTNYKIKILGRTSGFLNAFGEEVMEDTCNRVIGKLSQNTGLEVNDFTVAPRFIQHPEHTYMGCHEWLIEFNQKPNHTEAQICGIIDQELKKLSHDYNEKRKGDHIMCAPIITILEKGCFHRYLDQQKKTSVQSKIPRISSNRQLVDDLCSLI